MVPGVDILSFSLFTVSYCFSYEVSWDNMDVFFDKIPLSLICI